MQYIALITFAVWDFDAAFVDVDYGVIITKLFLYRKKLIKPYIDGFLHPNLMSYLASVLMLLTVIFDYGFVNSQDDYRFITHTPSSGALFFDHFAPNLRFAGQELGMMSTVGVVVNAIYRFHLSLPPVEGVCYTILGRYLIVLDTTSYFLLYSRCCNSRAMLYC